MIDNFQAPWWLKGPHGQTIWPTLMRIRSRMPAKWERVELPDGDFLDCVWDKTSYADIQKPIVVILHGLEGGINSSYSKGLMTALTKKGFRPVLMHFRTCSGTMNRLERTYHSGDTGDLDFVVRHLKERHPKAPIHAVGISIGGNVLLKWLGRDEKHAAKVRSRCLRTFCPPNCSR